MDDLVLRIGRLAYRNPGWTPACGDASLARQPADLAPDADAISTVLAAVHHAADTLTHIAVTDRRCVRQAAADHRLYIPTRLLPEDCDIPYPYAPAPRSRVTPCWTATASRSRPAPLPPQPSTALRSQPEPHPACWPQPTPLPRSPIAKCQHRVKYRQTERGTSYRQGSLQPRPCNPAASRTWSVTFSSRNQPC